MSDLICVSAIIEETPRGGGAFNRVGREARFPVRSDAIIIKKAGNNNGRYSVCVTDGESHFVSYDRRRNSCFFQAVYE